MYGLLNRNAALDAAHSLYTSFYWDEAEQRGLGHGPGVELTEITPRAADSDLEPIICYYIGRLEGAWGVSLGAVFYHMDLTDSEQGDALFALLMSCHGHGIGITDRYAEGFEQAQINLHRTLDPSPIYDEGTPWSDLADAQLEAEGYPYEPEDAYS